MASIDHGFRASGFLRPFRPALRMAGRHVLDAILPPQCLSCRTLVAEPGQLCADCWREIRFIEAPFCSVCGRPFEFDSGPETLCGDCAARKPSFARARAVMVYDDHSRDLVLGFKRGDRLEGADFIMPVPLHRRRLFTRRFNQAAVLAHSVGKTAQVQVLSDGLMRTRATPTQAGLSRSGRFRNVRGAFAIRPRHRAAIRDRHIILVDDVMTTGATVDGCARAILRAGAARVSVITLARVVQHL